MSIIIQKFGGSSVADTEKLFNVCKHIKRELDLNNQVVVVVSAQGKTTDKLLAEIKEITENPNKRELDVIASVGEQITISKLSMCLEKEGINAVSLTGWQIPIVTTNIHADAKIKHVDVKRLKEELEKGNVVIVAGFQGVDEELNITTLGRGGSDTTAVAIGAALQASRCEIYTDVDGVYFSDPKVIKDVEKIKVISYDEMLELASLGAKVLHNKCVEIGKKYNVPIVVKSTFEENSEGTAVTNNVNMEDICISGITKESNVARISIVGLEGKFGQVYKVFKLLSDHNVNVDIIVQPFSEANSRDLSFSISSKELKETLNVLNSNLKSIDAEEVLYSDHLTKVSIVGLSMVNNPGIAATIFGALYDENINIHMISTSEIKISVLVNEEEADTAMKAINDKFLQNNK